ncbi:MAG TPA: hypothetical protein VKE70_15685 [Candidatus Solibacter sp.]|nr:hypothetical protein [Candidatus Solibacter sp.]
MILVKYKNGRVLRGIALSLGDHKIRVAIQGSDDAVEYRMVSGAWISEDCEVVSFEFADRDLASEDAREMPETIFPNEFHAPALPLIM